MLTLKSDEVCEVGCYWFFFLSSSESFWDWTDWDSQYFKLGGGVLHSSCSGWIWVDSSDSAWYQIVRVCMENNNNFSTLNHNGTKPLMQEHFLSQPAPPSLRHH